MQKARATRRKYVKFFHKPPSNRVPRHIDDLVNVQQLPETQTEKQSNCGHLSLFTKEERTRSTPSRTLSTLTMK